MKQQTHSVNIEEISKIVHTDLISFNVFCLGIRIPIIELGILEYNFSEKQWRGVLAKEDPTNKAVSF